MKKSYLMIAAAATLLTACMDNEIRNDVKDFSESAIGFSTYATLQTKAENNEDATHLWDLENHHTSFDVWAWKYYDGAWEGTAVYNKGTVNYANSTWTATELKFWDKSAEKYYFYAAAPSSDKWVLNNNGTASVFDDDYLTYAEFSLKGDANINSTDYSPSFNAVRTSDIDLMIAENNQVDRVHYNKTPADVVNEQFDHILSRLNVTVALKAGGTIATLNGDDDVTNDVEVKVTNFAITGVNLKNNGSFNENADLEGDVLAEGTTKRWHTLSTVGTYNFDGYDISNTELTTTALYIAQYLVIPQSITSEILDRATPTNIVYYTQAEVDAYNAALAGALNSSDVLDADQATAYNTAINPSTDKAAGDVLSADEAKEYNATLTGAKSTTDVKSFGAAAAHPYFVISYTIDNQPYTAYYNLANAFGVAADGTLAFCEGWQNTLNIKLDAETILFDAEVYEWTDKANPDLEIK